MIRWKISRAIYKEGDRMSQTIPFPNQDKKLIRQAIEAYDNEKFEITCGYLEQAKVMSQDDREFIGDVIKILLENDFVSEAIDLSQKADDWHFHHLQIDEPSEKFSFQELVANQCQDKKNQLRDILLSKEKGAILPEVVIETILSNELNEDSEISPISDTEFYTILGRLLSFQPISLMEQQSLVTYLQTHANELPLSQWQLLIENAPRLLRADLISLYKQTHTESLTVSVKNLENQSETMKLQELTSLENTSFFNSGLKWIDKSYGENSLLREALINQWGMLCAIIYPFYDELLLDEEEVLRLIANPDDKHRLAELSADQLQQWQIIIKEWLSIVGSD